MGRHHLRRLVLAAGAALAACGGGPPSPTSPSQRTPFPDPDTLIPVTYVLSGTVRDYSGRPLPSIQVSLGYTNSSAEPSITTSDASGQYQFHGVRGQVSVSATADGYYDDLHRIKVDASRTQDLELMPGLSVAAGGSVTAEVHPGPHNGPCRGFLVDPEKSDPCRLVTVSNTHDGTLIATLTWNGPPALALSQRVYIAYDIPGDGPTACCDSGLSLSVPVHSGGGAAFVVRLKDHDSAPVTFTLSSTVEP